MIPIPIQLPEAVAQISGIIRKWRGDSPFFFIIGAGVSSPQVPLASGMIEDFKRSAGTPPNPLPEAPIDVYSNWFRAAHHNAAERGEYLKKIIKDKPISIATLRLAHLLAEVPEIKFVVTPNFDDFLARGLQLFGTQYRSLDTPKAIQTARTSDPSVIHILHVHGSYHNYDIANLKGEIQQTAAGNASVPAIKKIMSERERAPLVVGYSGWEEDAIMTAMKRRLREHCPYNTYWFCYESFDQTKASLPAWLRNSPFVTFVEPEAGGGPLPATRVFATLLDALRPEDRMRARDPLAFFLSRLQALLPRLEPEDLAGDPIDADLYLFSKRLLGFYANRETLSRAFDPIQMMHRATRGSEILAAGRTLIGWYKFHREMRAYAQEKGLRFKFLLSDRASDKYLPAAQVKEIRTVRDQVERGFKQLVDDDPKHFDVRLIDHSILDGVTFASLGEGSTGADSSRLIALFDVNAAQGTDKPTLALGCTCPRNASAAATCTVHGLHARTMHLFGLGKPLAPPPSDPEVRVVERYDEGLAVRNNRPDQYRKHLPGVFAKIAGNSAFLPPPICIQVHVASVCNTSCGMCDHWRKEAKNGNELTNEEWGKFFRRLPGCSDGDGCGVRTVIFSGGEPLAHPNIDTILQTAKASGLQIGLLTSGIVVGDRREDVLKAIRENVSWISVSIDGSKDVESHIRNPWDPASHRSAGLNRAAELQRFCKSMAEPGPTAPPVLTATVTLQSRNIESDLGELSQYIQNLGIPRVNFKFVTGSVKALGGKHPDYLIDARKLEKFRDDLLSSGLPMRDGNNLGYLRRCLVSETFQLQDVADGMPLQTFYKDKDYRCFTPFLFAMVDSDGQVYPCCHLYRDNHGMNAMTPSYREQHSMGNLKEYDFDLMAIWRGHKYETLRDQLAVINPDDERFHPCGECTRHYAHNRALTELYDCYQDNDLRFARWANGGPKDPVVWF